jgi:hypothetical protein
VVSLEPYVELIVALLQQQLHDFEPSAMNQMEEVSYDGIALRQMEQRGLISEENHQSQSVLFSLVRKQMLSVPEVMNNIQDKKRRSLGIRYEVDLFLGRKDR